jgi:pantetheine-phosphate adenylyltransferase
MRSIYAFSGDPITYGHIDIVRRAARTYDEVVVGIGENPSKVGRYLFTTDERLDFARRCLEDLANVRCVSFQGLLAEYAYLNGFDVIVRGVRSGADLEHELIQFDVNHSLHSSVDTVFFPARREMAHISSGVVKAIVREGGDVSDYCPLIVKEALERKILGKFRIGLAGGIAAGKTYFARRLVEALQADGRTASYVSLDAVGHFVLSDAADPIYASTRQTICDEFGAELAEPDSSINRQKLGKIVFADARALDRLNAIMREPMLARLYHETRALPPGIVVIEGAILVEANWTDLVNNNVVLVDAPLEMRCERLMDRSGIDRDEAMSKIMRQIAQPERLAILNQRIDRDGWGRLWEIDDSGDNTLLNGLVTELGELGC